MNQFKISAPNNLSLFGEFVVKHGKLGLTTGIELRTTLTFAELSEQIIELAFPQIDLLLSIPLQQFVTFYRQCEEDYMNRYLLRQHVLEFLTSNSHFYSTEDQRIIVQIFFYLLVYITYVEKIKITPFRMTLSTELIIDTDFVCLTSSVVCFAVSFIHWSNLQKDVRRVLYNCDLENARLYAIMCKEISCKIEFAGVTACTYGSIIQHRITDNCNFFIFIRTILNQTILLVDSRHETNLETQVLRLTDLVDINPVAATFLFHRIDFATRLVSGIFQKLSLYTSDECLSETQRLMVRLEHHKIMTFIDISQKLLQLLNVSHYHLDEICAIAQKHGMYGKYTDIGNGRCAYIWCPPDISEKRITFLSQDLRSQRFGVTVTSLARCGIKLE